MHRSSVFAIQQLRVHQVPAKRRLCTAEGDRCAARSALSAGPVLGKEEKKKGPGVCTTGVGDDTGKARGRRLRMGMDGRVLDIGLIAMLLCT